MTEFDKDVEQALDLTQAEQEDKPPEYDKRTRRAMRTSTFKAIAALEYGPPEQWEEGLLDETVDNALAVERVRWFERELWMLGLVVLVVGAFVAGWHMRPIPEPEPVQWNCTVEYDNGGEEQVDCRGEGER